MRSGSWLFIVATLVMASTAEARDCLPKTFPAGDRPWITAGGDFDGDGDFDVVATNPDLDVVNVLLSNGDGTFQLPIAFSAGNDPRSVAVADLDGDSVLDLVTDGDGVSVLLGNGDGSFQAPVAFPAGSGSNFVAVADLDGDGVPDIVSTNRFDFDVTVLRGIGDGSFQAAVSFATSGTPIFVAIADLDGDTIPDLVITNFRNRDVSVMQGNGDGSFQAPVPFPSAGDFPVYVTVADLNDDTIPDLVTANNNTGDVSVLIGNGDATFQAPAVYDAGITTVSVVAADFDGDAIVDLAAASESSGEVSLLRGNGDGTFQPSIDYSAGWPQYLVVADFNGDTALDIAASSARFDQVSVLLGNGDGSFRAAHRVAAAQGARTIRVADLNGDSALDIVTNSFPVQPRDADDAVGVLLGNGDGSFQAPASFAVGDEPWGIAIADFDGDSVPDVVTANNGPFTFPFDPNDGGLSVLIGNGDGSFQTQLSLEVRDDPTSVTVGDFDGDRAIDIVSASSISHDVSVLLGNGDGTFQPPTTFPAGNGPDEVTAADFDGDSVLDLVVTDRSILPGSVSVLMGNGDGSFEDPVPFMTGGRPASVVVADFDGDSNPDLATANLDDFFGSSGVSVLLGNGDGTFHAATTFEIGRDPRFITATDVDGDTVVDLVTANILTLDVSVLFGKGDGSFWDAVHLLMGGGPQSVALADLDGDAALDFAVANFNNWIGILLNPCEPIARPEVVVKPDSDPNSINPSLEGVLPVAILGSERFDVTTVDATKLAFGTSGAPLVHYRGPHFEDLNGDDLMDLIGHFSPADSGIAFGDRIACLSGETLDGTAFEGCDSVRTVPDMDGDQLLDIEEEALGTHALRADTDGDGFDDGEEVLIMGTDPLDALDPKPAPRPVRDRKQKGTRR